MYIPEFAIRENEKPLLATRLNRPVNIALKENIRAYVVDDKSFNEICFIIEQFREGQIQEDQKNMPSGARPSLLRAVATVFNVMVDVQKIKDPDIKTAAAASVLAAVMSIFAQSPEYGNRLLSILKSKI